MAGWNTIDALTGGVHGRCAAADRSWCFTERRPGEKVRLFLPPIQTALLAEDPYSQPVIVSGCNLARPQRAPRPVSVTQQDLHVVIDTAARHEDGRLGACIWFGVTIATASMPSVRAASACAMVRKSG